MHRYLHLFLPTSALTGFGALYFASIKASCPRPAGLRRQSSSGGHSCFTGRLIAVTATARVRYNLRDRLSLLPKAVPVTPRARARSPRRCITALVE